GGTRRAPRLFGAGGPEGAGQGRSCADGRRVKCSTGRRRAGRAPSVNLGGCAMLTATVVSLHRYPVKSMRGEQLDRVDVGFQGLAGDRRYAFVQATGGRPQFPWLTAREHPALMSYQPEWDTSGPRPALRVRCPD